MNRIILIGNGFDLAHDIETSYSHFLNSYWEKTIEDIFNSNHNLTFINEQIKIKSCPLGIRKDFNFLELKKYIMDNRGELIFINKFLEKITEKQNIQDWVDVEEEYYKLLESRLDLISIDNGDGVVKLNADFKEIQNLLEKHLIEAVRKKRLNNNHYHCIGENIYSKFNLDDFTEEAKKQFIHDKEGKLVVNVQNNHKQENDFLNEPNSNNISLLPDEIIFLNFNYTKTCYLYTKDKIPFDADIKTLSSRIINIHGRISDAKNPIIFGYGDELDDKYKLLEKANDNRFLENIKSIKYFETNNYKKLLQYISSETYQVFIMGHSCGTSDRTLLNTLFEHENCQSIKFFYHKKNSGEDNYSDIIRNISRNFNNKVVMRDKVANKEHSEPLL